jgi:acetyltransferase-like isoleucine patch superfamily enzyme
MSYCFVLRWPGKKMKCLTCVQYLIMALLSGERMRSRIILTSFLFILIVMPFRVNAFFWGHAWIKEIPHATVSPNTVLGRFSFINRAASIGHDVYIGEYSRVGPSAAIATFCRIGCRTSVNIGATVIDRIHIGDNSVVGASVLVTRDLPHNVVAFGTPAKIVRDKPLENFNGISF